MHSSDSATGGFGQLGFPPTVLSAIDEIGYEQPSPIQARSIPVLLAGRDLLGQAQTGTGKTAAFALPLLSRIDLSRRLPQGLVLTPTRELAIQVAEAFQTYARHLKGFHVLPIYGGQHIGEQLRSLRRNVHVVVGTPGRVIDHLSRGTLDLSALATVVIDEADEMLRMGFIEEVEQILTETPDNKQVALFSATMPRDIKRIAERYLKNPERVHIETRTRTVESVRQRFVQVAHGHKLDALTRILEVESFDGLLIFARTRIATMELAEKLVARGYRCGALNGEMTQPLREKTVDQLRRGALDIVVATDVAARGLDVERVSHVINYDIPPDNEAYVHRIGRTGRAGRSGQAISFVSPRETHLLKAIERSTRQPMERMAIPSVEDVADRRVSDFKVRITETIDSEDLSTFLELVDSHAAEHDTDAREIAAALALLLQKERPLAPGMREIPAPEPSGSRGARRDREPRPGGRPGRQHVERSGRRDKPVEPGMVRYRIDVGREHGVQPKNVVGAIANEAGLSARDIGQIHFHQAFSTVDLPAGMPSELRKHLQSVVVCGRPLKLRQWRDDGPPRAPEAERARRSTARPAGHPSARNDDRKAPPKRKSPAKTKGPGSKPATGGKHAKSRKKRDVPTD
ncbi:MAG: ATP-dependent helicase [Proteobacteria bacterium]|nr:MAG: ATP-dependent helicase [Pseudomonadota bacterium]